jgi:hypothetical protein
MFPMKYGQEHARAPDLVGKLSRVSVQARIKLRLQAPRFHLETV